MWTDEVCARVGCREDTPGLCGRQFEPGYDGDRLDLLCPSEPDKVSDPLWRDGRAHPPLRPSILRELGQHLRQRNTRSTHVLRTQLPQVASDKSSDERGGDVVRVSLDHERKVEDSAEREVELTELGSEDDTSDDGRS